MALRKPFNVSVSGSMGSNLVSLGWQDRDGTRYHAWVDADTLEPTRDSMKSRPVLYKNPPLKEDGTVRKMDSEGYFKTRYLSFDTPANAAMLATAQAEARKRGLVAEFRATQQRAEDERQARNREAYLRKLKCDAGPELYDALQAAVEAHGPMGDDSRPAWWQPALDALVKATTPPKSEPGVAL